MTTTDKPGDPADKAADGAFGGVHSHRAGYGDDKLQRVIGWLRERPLATLASGEGGLLLAEIDRLSAVNDMTKQDAVLLEFFDWNPRSATEDAKAMADEIVRLRAEISAVKAELGTYGNVQVRPLREVEG